MAVWLISGYGHENCLYNNLAGILRPRARAFDISRFSKYPESGSV